MRNAKIVCTLGPSSDGPSTIRALADAGMAVARVNASHGTRADREAIIDHISDVDDAVDQPVATMLDTRGPEIRTAELDEPIRLEQGSDIRFVEGETATPEVIGLSVSLSNLEAGDRILLDDGRIETTVTAVEDSEITAVVDVGGELGSRRGVNIPGVELDIEVVTEPDREDLALAAEKHVDFVAASFVSSADDVLAVSETIESFGADIPIIAKIELDAAVDNLDEIIDAAYGVMVARGDLGVECPLEDVPLIQKRIIRQSRNAGVPVITATEMLDSMIAERRPTRAEASDVANAVLDGTDAVMLSGETAIGEHPVRVVETMARIIRQVEASGEYTERTEQRIPPAEDASTDALARSARFLARDVGASAIIVASETGYTALKAAKFRPEVPIIAATPSDRVRRQLSLSGGVSPNYADLGGKGAAGVIENAVNAGLETELVSSGETVVVLSGMMTDIDQSTTNTLKVHVAAETLAAGRGVVSGRAVGPLARSRTGDLSGVPEGAVLYLTEDFDDEFSGDLAKLSGIIHERRGMTGYPAMIARELEIPMASGIKLQWEETGESVVTLDGNRGIVYSGRITQR